MCFYSVMQTITEAEKRGDFRCSDFGQVQCLHIFFFPLQRHALTCVFSQPAVLVFM